MADVAESVKALGLLGVVAVGIVGVSMMVVSGKPAETDEGFIDVSIAEEFLPEYHVSLAPPIVNPELTAVTASEAITEQMEQQQAVAAAVVLADRR